MVLICCFFIYIHIIHIIKSFILKYLHQLLSAICNKQNKRFLWWINKWMIHDWWYMMIYWVELAIRRGKASRVVAALTGAPLYFILQTLSKKKVTWKVEFFKKYRKSGYFLRGEENRQTCVLYICCMLQLYFHVSSCNFSSIGCLQIDWFKIINQREAKNIHVLTLVILTLSCLYKCPWLYLIWDWHPWRLCVVVLPQTNVIMVY